MPTSSSPIHSTRRSAQRNPKKPLPANSTARSRPADDSAPIPKAPSEADQRAAEAKVVVQALTEGNLLGLALEFQNVPGLPSNLGDDSEKSSKDDSEVDSIRTEILYDQIRSMTALRASDSIERLFRLTEDLLGTDKTGPRTSKKRKREHVPSATSSSSAGAEEDKEWPRKSAQKSRRREDAVQDAIQESGQESVQDTALAGDKVKADDVMPAIDAVYAISELLRALSSYTEIRNDRLRLKAMRAIVTMEVYRFYARIDRRSDAPAPHSTHPEAPQPQATSQSTPKEPLRRSSRITKLNK